MEEVLKRLKKLTRRQRDFLVHQGKDPDDYLFSYESKDNVLFYNKKLV